MRIRCFAFVPTIALAALLAVSACSKGEAPPPPPPPTLDAMAPIVVPKAAWTPEALAEIERVIEAKEGITDGADRTKALTQAATALVDPLLAAQSAADAAPAVRAKAAELLVRIGGYVADPAKADMVVRQALLPALADPAAPTAPGDKRLAAVQALIGLAGRLTPERAGEALMKVVALAKSIRSAWACDDRAARLQDPARVSAQEAALLKILEAVGVSLVRGPQDPARADALGVLADALRESPDWQDAAVHQAAADAVVTAAPALGSADLGAIVPALVEALFINGVASGDPAAGDAVQAPADVPLFPWADRALVRLARVGDGQRGVVLAELLRALAVTPADDPAGAPPGRSDRTPNENLALRARPCGRLLGAACAANADALRAITAADAAACNKDKDPDQPGSGFDPGFEPGRIWETVGAVLVDVLPRPVVAEGPAAVDAGTIELLTRQVRNTDEWAVRVAETRAFHDRLAALYPEFMTEAPPAAPPPPPEATDATPRRRAPRGPTPSPTLKPLIEALKGLITAEGTPQPVPEARAAAESLAAALQRPEARPVDRQISKDLLRPFFDSVRNELLALADFANEYAAVDARLWRTIEAARTLARLGAAGPDDATLRAILRLTRFALDDANGFPITRFKAFPRLLLRSVRRFGPDGQPLTALPPVPLLLDAIRDFARPTPEVMNFLLHVVAASALVGDTTNATLEVQSHDLVDADALTYRFLAARAFFALFRSDGALPDAERYAGLFRFHARDLQPLLALEKGVADAPAFRLFPPPVPTLPGTTPADDDWLAAPPARPQTFGFEAYRDALAACALRDKENPDDVAQWRRDMNDDEKTIYCKKWVEPFASLYAAEVRDRDVPRLAIADARCWDQMKERMDRESTFCVDLGAARRPTESLGLTTTQCRQVEQDQNTFLYCAALRFAPQFVEKGLPTLWGCYDRFPWLRAREPVGPSCDSLAERLLAAYEYVKLRSEAGIAPEDGVTYEALTAILPLEDYLRFVQTFAAQPAAALLGRVERLADELAKVQLDFPVFRRPPNPAGELARTGTRRPDGFDAPEFVNEPWYVHEDWVSREPRTFSDLRTAFRDACRKESDPPTAPCAADGGRLARDLRLTGEGGAPGPLVQGAVSLALLLGRGHVLDLARMVAVLTDADPCEQAGKLDPACLTIAVFAPPATADSADAFRRAAAIYRLVQLGAAGDAAAGEPICRVVLEADKLPGELLPVAEYAFRRVQPACGEGAWTPAREALLDPDGRWAQPVASGGPFVESAAASWWPRGGHGAGAAGQPGRGLEPQAEPGEPTVTGAVGLEVVRRIVAQRRPQLRRCYETALRTVPGLQGRVAVKFTIAAAGGVEQASVVENQTGDDRLAECIADVLEGMVFPELDAPTEVVYPFQFGLVQADASP